MDNIQNYDSFSNIYCHKPIDFSVIIVLYYGDWIKEDDLDVDGGMM
jgi:hypothetical protein